MKLIDLHSIRHGGLAAISLAALAIPALADDVTVDGVRDNSGPEGYTLLHTQTTQSNWGGPNQSLANLYAKQQGGTLYLHLAGKVDGNAMILFLDTKPGGVNFIKNNQITSGGDEYAINNLGSSSTSGLTFEAGFAADYAIRIYGSGTGAYVNIYNLVTGVRTYAGDSGAATITSGIISAMKTVWGDVALAGYATASLGVEIGLPLAGVGVPQGTQNIAMTAILVNGGSDYGSNQVLGSRVGPGDMGGGMAAINFQTEANTQTLNFSVDNIDTDGDGIPNSTDPDDDNDGLLDGVETNTGIYTGPSDTGTNPLLVDTDGDTYPDGDEVTGSSSLGYISNPNLDNYTSMAVPGNFTTPMWKEDGSAGNSMTQGSTASLTAQYQWALDYNFTTRGGIAYKYAANGTWDKNWGNGGNDINATIQATGFHRFSFNNSTLVRSLARTVFPDVNAYLSAYGIAAGIDSDGDGILNENEFTANTDPTQADSDGDGLNDLVDTAPLVPYNYATWASANAGSQAANLDYDGDGVKNGVEYFMGQTGSTFTTNPQPQANVVSWPHDPAASGLTYKVWTSLDLSAWTEVTGSTTDSGGILSYVLPTATPSRFVRLEVSVP